MAAVSWPSTQASLLLQLREFENRAAWQQFVDTYGPLIFRFCRRRGLQDNDAHDVTQEVFRQIARAIGRFDYDRDRGRFRSWLGTITRHEIERYRRKESHARRGIGGDGFDRVAATIGTECDAEWVDAFNAHVCQAAIRRIRPEFDEETWRTFELIWSQNRPSQEVAAELGRKPAWVYKAKFNVLQRLKAEVLALADDLPTGR